MFDTYPMLNHLLNYLSAFVILLHCVGVTQLVSSYVNDKSVFISMLKMTEEETKKESQSAEDYDDLKHHRTRYSFPAASLNFQDSRLYLSESKVRITDQFISDNVTPPPDCKG